MTLAIPIYLTKTIKIMQDRKLFISLAAALTMAAGLTSCSNDDVLEGQPLDGRTPITLTSSVATRSVSQTLQDGQIARGVDVGVFAQSNATAIENGDNNRLTADGAGAFTGETMYFPEEGGVSIYAYAPYNSAWTGQLNSNNEFTVPADQSTDEGYLAADLILGTPSTGNPVASTNDAIQLNFKHKLTKLNLDFKLGESGVDLKGATVSVTNVLGTTTVNVGESTTGNAQGNPTDIIAAKFAADATEFSASAIFVPQAVLGQTDFVLVSTADGKQYKAALNKDVTFAEGKKYTYTVQFNGGGDEPVTIELKLGSVLDNWDEGNEDIGGGTEETVAYGIGDYMLSDGTFVKNTGLTDEQKKNVVAVIFSKQVSEADAEEGYNAYAMGVERFGNKGWFMGNVALGSTCADFDAANADLDGLSKTQAILSNDAYTSIDETQKVNSFVNYTNYTNNHPLPASGTSQWFTPSFGQMVQIFNNLGGANIPNEAEIHSNNTSSPMYYIESKDVLDKINAYVTVLGQYEMFVTDGSGSLPYLTVTEFDENRLWSFQTRQVTASGDDTVYAWGFGKNATKSQNGRSVAPCVAITLPEAE